MRIWSVDRRRCLPFQVWLGTFRKGRMDSWRPGAWDTYWMQLGPKIWSCNGNALQWLCLEECVLNCLIPMLQWIHGILLLSFVVFPIILTPQPSVHMDKVLWAACLNHKDFDFLLPESNRRKKGFRRLNSGKETMSLVKQNSAQIVLSSCNLLKLHPRYSFGIRIWRAHQPSLMTVPECSTEVANLWLAKMCHLLTPLQGSSAIWSTTVTTF